MFQFNPRASFSDPNPTNVNLNTALPNSHGKVRTLKEDYEDLKKGKLKKEQELLSEEIAGVNSLAADSAPAPAVAPVSRPIAELPKPPAQSALLPPKENEKHEYQKEISGSVGSQSFFSGKPPFEEESQPSLAQNKNAEAPKRKLPKNLIAITISIVILVILGGGSYYWFFIKKSPSQNTITPTAQTKPTQTQNIQPENKSLRYLNIDASLGKEGNQKAFQAIAENFLASAAEDDLIEVKVLDKNNQPATPKDLEADLGFSLPNKLSEDITSDYSLFIKKEISGARTGAAFKVINTAGLLDELAQQENNLPSQLTPFYLKENPTSAVTGFNSGKYKNADIRYFNFPDSSGTSLDYSVLTDRQNGYFVFATSRDTLRSILDFMWGK